MVEVSNEEYSKLIKEVVNPLEDRFFVSGEFYYWYEIYPQDLMKWRRNRE